MTFREALDRKPYATPAEMEARRSEKKNCPVCSNAFYRKPQEHITYWERRLTCGYRCSSARRSKSREDFWRQVAKAGPDDCWEWQGGATPTGYFRTEVKGVGYQVHRFAYQDHYGRDPGELFVCHTCDNRACCNPAHLWLGTNADNLRDMRLKNRGTAKLTPQGVRTIRERYAAGGVLQRELAEEYGVHQMQISRIVRRTQWRHHR